MKHDSAVITYVNPGRAPWALKSDAADAVFSGAYGDLIGVPEAYPPEPHEHTKSEITDFPEFVAGDSISVTESGGAVTIAVSPSGVSTSLIPFDSILTSYDGQVLVSSSGNVLTS